MFCSVLFHRIEKANEYLITLSYTKRDHRGDTEFQKNQSVQVQDQRLSFYQMYVDYFGK